MNEQAESTRASGADSGLTAAGVPIASSESTPSKTPKPTYVELEAEYERHPAKRDRAG